MLTRLYATVTVEEPIVLMFALACALVLLVFVVLDTAVALEVSMPFRSLLFGVVVMAVMMVFKVDAAFDNSTVSEFARSAFIAQSVMVRLFKCSYLAAVLANLHAVTGSAIHAAKARIMFGGK
ncbi:hypothetical protein FRB97_006256 [Tulasnella sp. 331]|nr:hypothetical protein FRB97_006256 [Tulasnella sp. 331]